MSMLLRIFGTLVGVSAVMLAASLVVMVFVRIVHYLANSRGKTLGEMLGSLNQGFRFDQGDEFRAGDVEQTTFVLDILTYPSLHEATQIGLAAAPAQTTDTMLKRRRKLANEVEYLAKTDLIAIVRAMCERSPDARVVKRSDEDLALPSRWFAGLPPEKRELSEFIAYVERWYLTLEGVGMQQFKVRARKLTAVLSGVLVVALNLDGFQLATDIFESEFEREFLMKQAPSLIERAQQMGATGADAPPPVNRDDLLKGSTETLKQVNGILNEPTLHLGWQQSWIARNWCACEAQGGLCGECILRRPADLFRWLFGLAFSSILLALGAPFWTEQLSTLLNFQNSVQLQLTQSNKPKKGEKSDDVSS